jgi:cellulose synthase operon protein B
MRTFAPTTADASPARTTLRASVSPVAALAMVTLAATMALPIAKAEAQQAATAAENAPASNGASALPQAPTVSAREFPNLLKAIQRLKPNSAVGPGATNATVGGGLSASPLHHLPPHPLGTRLSGESDSRTWPFYAGANQLGRPATFRLSYMNAVAVMPEGSFIEVFVNGEIVQKMPIHASVEPSTIDIEVPAQLLALGYNAITVKASQRHRVDCSPAATYELWTDIIENGTGFVTDGTESLVSTVADLPSVTPSADGKIRLRTLLPDRPSDQKVQNAFDLAQMIALAGDFSSPVIEIGEGFGPGIDLFVGSRAELMARAPDLAEMLTGPGPFHVVAEPQTGAIFVALIMEGEITRETMRKAVPIGKVQGTPLGLQTLAMFSPARIFEGRRTTLRALGFQDEEFAGRLYRRSFQLNLSPDFYPADYDVVKLDLTGAYAPGLSSRSAMTVRVNGITKTSIALGNARGATFKNKSIELALSAFKAGRNTIEVEAWLSKDGDVAECVPLTGNAETPRFMLSPDSTIIMPSIAHFGLLPDLGNSLRSGFPYVGASSLGTTKVFMADRQEQTLAAAAATIAHLASVAGQPVDFELQTGFPRGDESNAIIIGEIDAIPAVVTDTMSHIDGGKLRMKWQKPRSGQGSPEAEGQVDTMPTSAITTLGEGGAGETPGAPVVNPEEELRKFRERWTDTGESGGYLNILHGVQERIATILIDAGLRESADRLPDVLDPAASSLLVAQSLSPAGRGVWTLVTAKDAPSLTGELERFLRPEPISQATGLAVGFSAKTALVVNAGNPDLRSGILGKRSFGNLRLVIAGWLSNNPFVYVVGLLSAVLLGGLISHRFLQRHGRQDGHVTGTGLHG